MKSAWIKVLGMALALAVGCGAEAEPNEDELDEEAIGVASASLVTNGAVDLGFASLPRGNGDVNGDRKTDYCRFVGDAPNLFLSCKLGNSTEEYGFNSDPGVDVGYASRPRGFRDHNGDNKLDYCRYVGDAPNIRECCLNAAAGRFSSNQYDCSPDVRPPPTDPNAVNDLVTFSCTCNNGTWKTRNMCVRDQNDYSWVAQGTCQNFCLQFNASAWTWGATKVGDSCLQTGSDWGL